MYKNKLFTFLYGVVLASLPLSGSTFGHDIHYYVVQDIAAPFQIQDEQGAHSGIVTEIVYALGEQLGLELETVAAPTKRIERTLSDVTSFDWITYDAPAWNSLAGGQMLPEPLFEVKHVAMHCPEKDAATLFDNTPTVAIIKGFRYPELDDLSNRGLITLVNVRDYDKGFELVNLNRVDAFVEMDVRIHHQLSKKSSIEACSQLSDVDQVIKPYWIHLAVNKSMDAGRKRSIEDGIRELKANGKLHEILQRYGAY